MIEVWFMTPEDKVIDCRELELVPRMGEGVQLGHNEPVLFVGAVKHIIEGCRQGARVTLLSTEQARTFLGGVRS